MPKTHRTVKPSSKVGSVTPARALSAARRVAARRSEGGRPEGGRPEGDRQGAPVPPFKSAPALARG